MLTLQLPRPRRASARTAAPSPAACRCASSTTTATSVAAGEVGEIVRARADGDERLLEPARGERASASAAAGTTPTTSAGARPTARSRSSGPKTRMIKSAAENIYPAEVEGCIAAPPGGRRVRGDRRARPDVGAEREGDRRAHADGATATADEIIEHCRARIASYKKPRTVEFVDALPRARVRASTTTRSTRASAAAATPAGGTACRSACTPSSHRRSGRSYRRRIRMVDDRARRRRRRARGRLPPLRGDAAPRRRRSSRASRRRAALAVERRVPTPAGRSHALDGHAALAALHRGRRRSPTPHELHAPVRPRRAVRRPRRPRRHGAPVRRRADPGGAATASHAPARRDGELAARVDARWEGSTRWLVDPPPFATAPWRAGSCAGPTRLRPATKPRPRSCCAARATSAWAAAWTSTRSTAPTDPPTRWPASATRCSPRRSPVAPSHQGPDPRLRRRRGHAPAATTAADAGAHDARSLGGAGHLQPRIPCLRDARARPRDPRRRTARTGGGAP